MEISRGVGGGVSLKKNPFVGRYGYFLELLHVSASDTYKHYVSLW